MRAIPNEVYQAVVVKYGVNAVITHWAELVIPAGYSGYYSVTVQKTDALYHTTVLTSPIKDPVITQTGKQNI